MKKSKNIYCILLFAVLGITGLFGGEDGAVT